MSDRSNLTVTAPRAAASGATSAPATRPRVGLALAGGGPLGAIYEIGALCALEEALPGVDFNALDGYVGVSAGAVVAAGLANGLTPRQLLRSFIENDGPREDVIRPSLFFRPALGEYARRVAGVPLLAAQAVAGMLRGGPLVGALERLGAALPTGLFSSAPLQSHLQRAFAAPGRSDDFRRLPRRLVVVATDLDSGEPAPFGLPGYDDVPISRAVAASAALPGLFPPVRIGSRSYVDGALKKTLHASVLLDLRLDVVLCLNPLVPFDASRRPRHRVLGENGRIPNLVDGGLPVVLSQTFRSLIHSRLELGLKGYEATHPRTDIVLFEPDQRDPQMFVANVFAYSQRRRLAEHAYQHTRADLRSRRSVLGATLTRHGLALDAAALDDPDRVLVARSRPPRGTRAARALKRLDEVLDDLDHALALRG